MVFRRPRRDRGHPAPLPPARRPEHVLPVPGQPDHAPLLRDGHLDSVQGDHQGVQAAGGSERERERDVVTLPPDNHTSPFASF